MQSPTPREIRNYIGSFFRNFNPDRVLFLLIIFYCTSGASAAAIDSGVGESDSDGNGLELSMVLGGVACVVVLVVVLALCSENRIHSELFEKGPPYWTHNLEFRQDLNGGLTAVSEGLNNLSPFHVTRSRLGMAVTDGARWNSGFTDGKHVFEVVWPIKKNRGTCSSIGVGSMEVPLSKQGRLSLVGHHSQSWGYDLSSRKTSNNNKRTGSFQKQMPDRFYLYVDMDSGKIGFGEDVRTLGSEALFYGYVVNGIKVDKDRPLHLMVGMCAAREEVQVYYIGTAIAQGGFDLVPPVQPGPPPPYDKAQGSHQKSPDAPPEIKQADPVVVPQQAKY